MWTVSLINPTDQNQVRQNDYHIDVCENSTRSLRWIEGRKGTWHAIFLKLCQFSHFWRDHFNRNSPLESAITPNNEEIDPRSFDGSGPNVLTLLFWPRGRKQI